MAVSKREAWRLVLLAGLAATALGVQEVARASFGPDCTGHLHHTKLTFSGAWRYFGVDCSGECEGARDCELTAVPGTGGLLWQCGCNGWLDGLGDATHSLNGPSGSCTGGCDEGSCSPSSFHTCQDENGTWHKLTSCACG